jgi:hypothetical protein
MASWRAGDSDSTCSGAAELEAVDARCAGTAVAAGGAVAAATSTARWTGDKGVSAGAIAAGAAGIAPAGDEGKEVLGADVPSIGVLPVEEVSLSFDMAKGADGTGRAGGASTQDRE